MRRVSHFITITTDAPLRLKLTGTRTFPNGSVLLEYVRRGVESDVESDGDRDPEATS
jgi:hypothetical protein